MRERRQRCRSRGSYGDPRTTLPKPRASCHHFSQSPPTHAAVLKCMLLREIRESIAVSYIVLWVFWFRSSVFTLPVALHWLSHSFPSPFLTICSYRYCRFWIAHCFEESTNQIAVSYILCFRPEARYHPTRRIALPKPKLPISDSHNLFTQIVPLWNVRLFK